MLFLKKLFNLIISKNYFQFENVMKFMLGIFFNNDNDYIQNETNFF